MTFPATTLLVEDEESVATAYGNVFADEGIPLDVADTWESALEMFRVAGHSLVIADYNLPGNELGLRLLIAVKRLLPSSRLILISGAMSRPAEELAREIDFIDAFYTKKQDLADLLVNEARTAQAQAVEPTDWRSFGKGYLKDPETADPDLRRIDDALRADVSKKKRRD